MKKEQSNPVCTGSARSSNGNYTNTIEGGFNKLEEAALRCLQGMMPICFNGKAFMKPQLAITAAFGYAEEFLKQSEECRRDEVRTDVIDEEQQQEQSTIILP